MTITAKVIADSVSRQGIRLTTLELRYPKFIHGEFMTHRVFCLSGDARLDFDLPWAANPGKKCAHSMTLRDFADKWHNGAAEGPSSKFNGRMLDEIDKSTTYSANYIAALLGFAHAMNLNKACREGLVVGAFKSIEDGSWQASGEAWKDWRAAMGRRRFSLRSRLRRMNIRQVDESTGKIRLAHVVDCIISGEKPVFRVEAGEFSTVATKDHLFLTLFGWKRLAEITPGVDALVVYKYGTGEHEDRFRKIDGRWVCQWSRGIRDEVFRRQNGICGHTGEPLHTDFHVHHVEPRHLRPDLAFDIDNVMAVNVDAHKVIHGKQGWQTGVPLGTQAIQVASITPEGFVDTYDLEIDGDFPNFFADGIVVHNSRNASSSRAIPVERLVQDVLNDPAMPVFWGKNQKGMQAAEKLAGKDREAAVDYWLEARDYAVDQARALARLGAHKQIVNRVVEPWCHIRVVVTATDWANFFALRRHPDAQPEMRALADASSAGAQGVAPTLRSADGRGRVAESAVGLLRRELSRRVDSWPGQVVGGALRPRLLQDPRRARPERRGGPGTLRPAGRERAAARQSSGTPSNTGRAVL